MKTPAVVLATLAFWTVAGVTYWNFVEEPKSKAYAEQQARRDTAAAKIKADGMHIVSTKEVAPGQVIQLTVMPHSSGMDFLDLKCLIYTHTEYRQSTIVCPSANQTDIAQ